MFGRTVRFLGADLDITELRISFNVEKSLVGYPNLANIVIYNLSQSSRKKLEESAENISLYAGFEDTSTPLIFNGDVVNVIHFKDGPDWKSTVYAADGLVALENGVINKTLPAGASPSQILDELVQGLEGVSKGVIEGIQNCRSGKRSLLRELQMTGNIKDWLAKIANDCGFEYSINDGVFETVEEGLPVSTEPVTVINQASGMIGSPKRTEVGVNVTNLLLGELKLARTIRIESINRQINIGNLFFRDVSDITIDGIYRIDKLVHTGDTHDNTWQTDIQARSF